MIIRSRTVVACALGLFTAVAEVSSLAQLPGAGSPSGVNASLVKLFDGFPGFTAKADLQVMASSNKEWLALPMDFALLGNQLRADIDLTKARNQEVADSAASLKQMGMAEVISIVRPDKRQVYVLFPGVQSCLEIPIPKEESEVVEKTAKIERTALGKETIAGHPCVKNRTVVKSDGGQLLEATTWNATDLKDFPLQIESKEKDNTSLIRFKDVQFAKPAAGRFDVPANYTRYKNQQELMMGVARRMLGNGK
jgi:hypothetical protein